MPCRVSMPCPSLGRLSVRLWASLISWALSVAGPLLGQAIFLLGAICPCTFAVSSLTGAALVLGPYLVRLSFSLVLYVLALLVFGLPSLSLGGLSVRLWPFLTSWALSVAGPIPGQAIFLFGAISLGAPGVFSLTDWELH